MEKEKAEYFAFTSSEDGIDITGPMTKSELLQKLKPEPGEEMNYFGTEGFYSGVPPIDKGCFMQRDGQEKLLIIRGKIVVPQEKQVITEYDID